MRRIYIAVIALLLGGCLASCENDLPLYDNEECYLRFEYAKAADSLTTFSFVYTETTLDTVWLNVQLMGNIVSDRDRPITLKQVLAGEHDAVAGEHFVAFDDAELKKKFYYLPKDSIEQRIPILLKKTEAMDSVDFILKVAFVANDEFGLGSKEYASKKITISNQVTQPSRWGTSGTNYNLLGAYGKEKHKFMIRVSREKWDNDEMIWDDNWFNTTWQNYASKDVNYCKYVVGVFKEELAKLPEPLYEANGDLVTFP